MKISHLIFGITLLLMAGCLQKRSHTKCSVLIQDAPELEIRVDTIYGVKKYELRSVTQQSCPVEKVTWTFIHGQNESITINSDENRFVTIPHKLLSDASSSVELAATYIDGGQRTWNFPIADLITID